MISHSIIYSTISLLYVHCRWMDGIWIYYYIGGYSKFMIYYSTYSHIFPLIKSSNLPIYEYAYYVCQFTLNLISIDETALFRMVYTVFHHIEEYVNKKNNNKLCVCVFERVLGWDNIYWIYHFNGYQSINIVQWKKKSESSITL